jgi:glycosyltransferase involved in cell wall biosynthesis
LNIFLKILNCIQIKNSSVASSINTGVLNLDFLVDDEYFDQKEINIARKQSGTFDAKSR